MTALDAYAEFLRSTGPPAPPLAQRWNDVALRSRGRRHIRGLLDMVPGAIPEPERRACAYCGSRAPLSRKGRCRGCGA